VALLSRLGVTALLLSACASSQYPSLDDPMPPPEPRAPASPGGSVSATPRPGTAIAITSLQRADVERVVDAGLGRFLSHVGLEPRLSAGKFTGWSVVALEPPELWQGIDLQPGDIVTRVNGLPIERETEAFEAFQAVRQAPLLEVSYLRQNQPRTLRFTIVGAPSPTLPKAPAASSGRAGSG
jgi:S1-C subfamily serine protease